MQTTEKKTLLDLLKDYTIEIPMLQRDYAQGRKSQEKIAQGFLQSIFNVLKSKSAASLHIDFIYGYKKDGVFILIDGQQRITTLWLLYILLYKHAERLEDVQNLLEKFSYATRTSSSDFCENLLTKTFDLNKKPSLAIKDMGGEFVAEEDLYSDPTIKAMINMLDLIFEHIVSVRQPDALISKLESITFDVFDMNEFNLGEELYIKMNARGKELSKYENLKAFIQKQEEIYSDFNLLLSIDSAWCDYFFDSQSADMFDIRGRNFLHYATIFFHLTHRDKDSLHLDPLEFINKTDISIDEIFYSPLQKVENIKILDRTIKLFQLFKNNKLLKLSNSSFFDEKDNKENITLGSICYFMSVLSYAKKKQEISNEIEESFSDYLRVSRHLIENHPVDNEKDISSFVRLFEHLSNCLIQDDGNIYVFLSKNPTHNFNAKIYSQEVRKAKLIIQSRQQQDLWEEKLNLTSDHEGLVGWVDFLLDFSDPDFVAEKKKKTQYSAPNLEKFEKYSHLTMQILHKKFLDEHLPLFQRALMTIGNFGFESMNYFFGTSLITSYRDRESWNCLLNGSKNPKQFPYFKSFLDELLKIPEDIPLEEKMKRIIAKCNLEQKSWWEQLMIGDEELFAFLSKYKDNFQRTQRVRFHENPSNPKKVELLPKKKSKKDVYDLFDRAFYNFCRNKKCQKLSEYNCKEEQYGFNKFGGIQSHFIINDQRVICHSGNKTITIGEQNYEVDFSKNLFDEFERILKDISPKSFLNA